MRAIQTRTPLLPLLRPLRAAYLRWRLGHVEADIEAYRKTLNLWRAEAERLRVEVAQLEAS